MLTAPDLDTRFDAMRLDAPVSALAPRLQALPSPAPERPAPRPATRLVFGMAEEEYDSMWEDGMGSW